jgi:thiol-disulfide isomerase/thioredoxin
LSEVTHEDVLAAVHKGGKPVLLLLTAPSWCMPCRRFHPHWEKAKEQLPDVEFIEIDMGADPEKTSQHWAYELYEVRSVPTVLLMWKPRPGTVNDTRLEARGVVPFVNDVKAVLGD